MSDLDSSYAVARGKLSKQARELRSQLDELVVSNTIPLDERAAACERIRQLSIAELIAESIRRISQEESVGELFMD